MISSSSSILIRGILILIIDVVVVVFLFFFSPGPKKGARLKAIDVDMEPLTAFYF